MEGSQSPRDDSADAGSGSAGSGSATAGAADGAAGGDAADSAGAGDRRSRSSWVLVGSLRESAQALALAPLPDSPEICVAEAEELMFARDRITCALAERVGRVHRAGQAKQHGHASTRSWLRTAGGMGVAGAGRLLTLGVELARLPGVREAFAAGTLAAGVVEAICTATARLTDEQAGLVEPILLELAGRAGPAEVAKAGRYLRAVLDPDGEERDERADYGRRFLRVRPGKGGGLEGEFYLPREAAARLRALLDAYAKPRAEGDDRSLQVRQADALIALLEEKIAAELLVLVNAESLPADPEDATPADSTHADDTSDTDTSAPGDTEDPGDPGASEDAGASAPHDPRNTGDCALRDTGSVDDPGGSGAEAGAGAAVDAAAESAALAAAGPCGEEAGGCGAGQQRAGGRGPRDAVSTASAEGGDTAPVKGEDCARAEGQNRAPATGDDGALAEAEDTVAGEAEATGPGCPDQMADAEFPRGGGARPQAAPPHTAQPDPPPEDAAVRHTHAGHQPAGDCRHGQGTPGDHGDLRCGQSPLGTAQGASPGSAAGAAREALLGAAGTLQGALSGALLGTAPGLLLATGQMLPVSGVHRLARTSSLVRLVMDADGQVLDMGRKVRLATPAQRRAIFARYATCWIDGCPLPATMCQIDHADNWSSGGLTDLKLLGPACQFHNRDRYRHPGRYTRRKEGTDRWTFTYHRPPGARRLRM
ncbi:DUF222 domain-containing protein [Microbispora sp. NPDC046933]|uniref:HNH endonuclease signature motif containing protein n=1 Tax=Microbispora sp. NPDC046933 TaxID=3155618 RepID=UPI003402D1F7